LIGHELPKIGRRNVVACDLQSGQRIGDYIMSTVNVFNRVNELGQKTYMARLPIAMFTCYCCKHVQQRFVVGTKGGRSALNGVKKVFDSLIGRE